MFIQFYLVVITRENFSTLQWMHCIFLKENVGADTREIFFVDPLALSNVKNGSPGLDRWYPLEVWDCPDDLLESVEYH